jgi:hypothetical protein
MNEDLLSTVSDDGAALEATTVRLPLRIVSRRFNPRLKPVRERRLYLEPLEDRCVPSHTGLLEPVGVDFGDTFADAVLIGPLDFDAQTQTGETIAGGDVSTVHNTVTGDVSYDVDRFRFDIPVTQQDDPNTAINEAILPLTLTITQQAADGSDLDSLLTIYNAAGTLIRSNDDAFLPPPNSPLDSRIQLLVFPGETYFAQAGGFHISQGRYELIFELNGVPPDDFPDTFDPNQPELTPAIALSTSGFGNLSGRIEEATDLDVFTFVATASGLVTVAVNPAPGSSLEPQLNLYDASGDLVASAQPKSSTPNSVVQFEALAGERFFVEAGSSFSTFGAYQVLVATSLTPPDDFPDSLSVGLANIPTIALDSAGAGTQQGTIGHVGDLDVFQIVSPITGTLLIEQTAFLGNRLDAFLRVLDENGMLLASADGGGGGSDALVGFHAVAGQTYIIEAGSKPVSGTGFIGDGSFGSTSGDYDFYQFEARAGQSVTVDIDAFDLGTGLDSVVGIFDSLGSLLASNDDFGFSLDSFLTFTVPASGAYFVVVGGFGSGLPADPFAPGTGGGAGSTGSYSLTIVVGGTILTLSDTEPNDAIGQATITVTNVDRPPGATVGDYVLSIRAAPEDDYGNELGDAYPLNLPPTGIATVFASIDAPGDRDMFRFVAPFDGLMTITQTETALTSGLDSLLVVFDSSGTVLTANDDYDDGFGLTPNSQVQFFVTAGSTYFVRADAVRATTGIYQLDFAIDPSATQATSSEFLVNASQTAGVQTTTPLPQPTPVPQRAVGTDSAGNFVVVWSDNSFGDWDIWAQRFQADGTPVGGPILVAGTAADEQHAAVAVAAAGNFVVTWTETFAPGDRDIMARRFDANGSPLDVFPFAVAASAADEFQSSAAVDGSGAFVVSWTRTTGPGDNDVLAQRFDPSGNPVGGVIGVATTGDDEQFSAVDTDATGNFVVTWTSTFAPGDRDILAQQFDASGNVRGGTIYVAASYDDEFHSSVAVDDLGDFVISWTSTFSPGDNDILAQRFDASGNFLDFITVAESFDDEQFSTVASNGAGDFVITWSRLSSFSSWDVYAQAYSSSGAARGATRVVNATVAGEQRFSSVALGSNGYVVVWSGAGAGDSDGVFGSLVGSAGSISFALAEPNDAIPEATAIVLSLGQSVTGSAFIGDGPFGSTSGDYDFYSVVVDAGQTLVVDIDAEILGSTLDSKVVVYDSSGNVVAGNNDSGISVDSYLTFTAPVVGTYFVAIFSAASALPGDPMTPGTGTGGTGLVEPYEVTFALTANPFTPIESNDAILDATPTPVSLGQSVTTSGFVGDGPFGASSGDYDFYIVAAGSGQTITVDIDAEVLGSFLDSVVGIYDSGGALLASNDDAGFSFDSFLTFDVPAAGTYFVVVRGFGSGFPADPFTPGTGGGAGSTGAYDVTLSLSVSPEPNDSIGTATPVTLAVGQSQTVSDVIGNGPFGSSSGDYDFYSVAADAGQSITLDVDAEVNGSFLDSVVGIYDTAGNLLASNDDEDFSTLDSFLSFDVTTTGTYFVVVFDFVTDFPTDPFTPGTGSGSTGSQDFYELTISLSTTGVVTEPNDSITDATAVPVTLGSTVTLSGDIGDGPFGATTGDYDFFSVAADEGQTITVDIDAEEIGSFLDSVVGIYDAAGTLLDFNDDENFFTFDSFLTFDVTAAGTYFIVVFDFVTDFPLDPFTAGTGSGSTGFVDFYDISISLSTTPPAPPDDFGDSRFDASAVALSATGAGAQSGAIEGVGDEDFFSFTAAVSGNITILLTASSTGSLDPFVTVFDSSGTVIVSDDDSGPGLDSQASFVATAGQTYFVSAAASPIAFPGEETGGYDLTIRTAFGADVDSLFVFDPDKEVVLSPAGAGALAGTLEISFDDDVFWFVAPVSGTLVITGTASALSDAEVFLEVFDESAENDFFPTAIAESGFAGAGASTDSVVRVSVSAGRRYFVRAGGFGPGGYDLNFSTIRYDLNATDLVVLDLTSSDNDGNAVTAERLVASLLGVEAQFLATGILSGNGITVDLASIQYDGSLLAAGLFAGGSGVLDVSGGGPFQSGIVLTSGSAANVVGPNLHTGVTGFNSLPGNALLDQLVADTTTAVGFIGDNSLATGDYDYYTFDAAAGQTITVDINAQVNGSSLDSVIGLYDSFGNLLASNDDFGGSLDSFLTFVAPADDFYSVVVFGFGSGFQSDPFDDFTSGPVGSTGPYEITIALNGAILSGNASEFGDSALDANFVSFPTQDASVLTFSFDAAVNVVEFSFVFASDEYLEFVNSGFNDVFGFFVNGINYARIPGTGTAAADSGQIVAIDNVNSGQNGQFFINNSFLDQPPFGPIDIEFDGLTVVLTFRAPVIVGRNTITIAIADVGDTAFDSAVFIQAGTFSTVVEQVELQTAQQLLDAYAQIAGLPDFTGLTDDQIETDHLAIFEEFIKNVLAGTPVDTNNDGIADTIFSLGSALTGDFVIVFADPIDFNLATDNGTVATINGQQLNFSLNNVLYSTTGNFELLIIPNALAGQYQLQLAGVGSGDFRWGASYVSANGAITTILTQGILPTGQSQQFVLDFAELDGRVEFLTFRGQPGQPGQPTSGFASAVGLFSQAGLGFQSALTGVSATGLITNLTQVVTGLGLSLTTETGRDAAGQGTFFRLLVSIFSETFASAEMLAEHVGARLARWFGIPVDSWFVQLPWPRILRAFIGTYEPQLITPLALVDYLIARYGDEPLWQQLRQLLQLDQAAVAPAADDLFAAAMQDFDEPEYERLPDDFDWDEPAAAPWDAARDGDLDAGSSTLSEGDSMTFDWVIPLGDGQTQGLRGGDLALAGLLTAGLAAPNCRKRSRRQDVDARQLALRCGHNA